MLGYWVFTKVSIIFIVGCARADWLKRENTRCDLHGQKECSDTGTRTLVSCVKGKYANHLHHIGVEVFSNAPFHQQKPIHKYIITKAVFTTDDSILCRIHYILYCSRIYCIFCHSFQFIHLCCTYNWLFLSKYYIAPRGFDPRTFGLWAQHASSAPQSY